MSEVGGKYLGACRMMPLASRPRPREVQDLHEGQTPGEPIPDVRVGGCDGLPVGRLPPQELVQEALGDLFDLRFEVLPPFTPYGSL